MHPIIRVENLSKRYVLGGTKGLRSLRETLGDAFRWPGRRRGAAPEPARSTFWALKDVSFEVRRGEVIGIIGRNGAGKSTLLKILSRVTEPTSGWAELRGRVRSLLEVGTGFHPDLTGRENVYLNGAILGMRRQEIDARFDDIVAFAEVERFIDVPVKHYSSGMYVRLAFAVAAQLEPEILIIDEVLAVGDLEFQRRCLGRINDITRSGRTVLFVSHNLAAIENHCSRAMLLQEGAVACFGDVKEAVTRHVGQSVASTSLSFDLRSSPARRRHARPLMVGARLLDAEGRLLSHVVAGQPVVVELELVDGARMEQPYFSVSIDDANLVRLFVVSTELSTSRLPPLQGPCRVACRIDSLPLAPGSYFLSLSAGSVHQRQVDALDQVVRLEVAPADFFGTGILPGNNHGRFLVRSHWEACTPAGAV